MLGEKHHLADVAGQLGGIVGGEAGLGLPDPSHHREYVVAGLARAGVLALPRGDTADQDVVNALDHSGDLAGRQRRLVAPDQTTGQFLLRGPDRAAGLAVEVDRQVRDAAGWDVGGDVDLAPSDDAEIDHAAARGCIEPGVGGRQAGLVESPHEGAPGLGVVDPAKELPDGPEVLDVVDQRRARQCHK